MAVLAELSGQPYVDMYASEVKASLAAGKGYPHGTEPK
jgi:1-acyl-sn-glycerol-3-phosphate acyltransferase